MTAPTNDGTPRRDFVEYDHPDGLYTVEAHVVTAETEGEFPMAGGTYPKARAGDVVVRNGNYYDIYDAEAWANMELEGARDQEVLEPFPTEQSSAPEFDPAGTDAASVRRYLLNPNTSDEEKQRVARTERDGKNRQSAFPRGFVVTDAPDDEDFDDEEDDRV
jgi:hypothetical protein